MLEHLEHTKDACWGVRKDDIFIPYYKKLCSYFPNSIIEEKIDGIWFTIKGKSQQNFTDEEWKELKTKILEEI